jgi:hypothetical protein
MHFGQMSFEQIYFEKSLLDKSLLDKCLSNKSLSNKMLLLPILLLTNRRSLNRLLRSAAVPRRKKNCVKKLPPSFLSAKVSNL